MTAWLVLWENNTCTPNLRIYSLICRCAGDVASRHVDIPRVSSRRVRVTRSTEDIGAKDVDYSMYQAHGTTYSRCSDRCVPPCFFFNSNVCPHSQPFTRTLYISSCTACQLKQTTKQHHNSSLYHVTLIRSCAWVIYISAETCWCRCTTSDRHAVDCDVAGILMISGWLLLISFSMIFARFYKDSAPDEMPCGVKVWFMVGRYICLKDNILIMYPKYIVYPRLTLVNQTRRMI